jgi:hypothetical protein
LTGEASQIIFRVVIYSYVVTFQLLQFSLNRIPRIIFCSRSSSAILFFSSLVSWALSLSAKCYPLHDEKSKRKVHISMGYDGEECHTKYFCRDRVTFMKNKEMRHSDVIEQNTLVLI